MQVLSGFFVQFPSSWSLRWRALSLHRNFCRRLAYSWCVGTSGPLANVESRPLLHPSWWSLVKLYRWGNVTDVGLRPLLHLFPLSLFGIVAWAHHRVYLRVLSYLHLVDFLPLVFLFPV